MAHPTSDTVHHDAQAAVAHLSIPSGKRLPRVFLAAVYATKTCMDKVLTARSPVL